jgi:hypothetical protein
MASKTVPRASAQPHHELIGSLIRLAIEALAPRPQVLGARLWLAVAAGIGGAVALICFSVAALDLLEDHLTPAEAWGLLGLFYSLVGGVLYLAASRR